jgi:hypothetical protein
LYANKINTFDDLGGSIVAKFIWHNFFKYCTNNTATRCNAISRMRNYVVEVVRIHKWIRGLQHAIWHFTVTNSGCQLSVGNILINYPIEIQINLQNIMLKGSYWRVIPHSTNEDESAHRFIMFQLGLWTVCWAISCRFRHYPDTERRNVRKQTTFKIISKLHYGIKVSPFEIR